MAVRRVAVVAAASSILAALAACSSAGDPSGATRQPSPSGPATTAPGVAGASSSGSAASTGPGPTSGRSTGTARRSTPAAPLTGTAVPTGTAAPYQTPGREQSPPANQTHVLESVPGSGRAGCADPGSNATFRANGVAVGNFVQMRKSFAEQYGHTEVPELDAYVVPAHAKRLRTVTATVASLSGGSTRRVSSSSVQQGDAASYFALQLPVEKPGRYRLTFVLRARQRLLRRHVPGPVTDRVVGRS